MTDWMLVILTGLYVLVTTAQLSALHGQWNQMRTTNDLVRAANEGAQRAWVLSVEHAPFTLVADQEIRVPTLLRNYGKSPAWNVRVRGFASALSQSPDELAPLPLEESINNALVGPDQSYEVVLSFRLSADEVAVILKGAKRLYLYGTIAYSDAFNADRVTTFCSFYNPAAKSTKTQTVFCARGNRAI